MPLLEVNCCKLIVFVPRFFDNAEEIEALREESDFKFFIFNILFKKSRENGKRPIMTLK
jgi:hypothetical protein